MKTKMICLALALGACLCTTQTTAGEGKEKKKTDGKGVIAVFSLDGSVLETPAKEDFLFVSQRGESLKDLVARMKEARDDKDVKACVLMLENASLNLAQTEEIRQVMDQIKSAGKPIHTHADSLSTGSYALLSGASRISVVPTGDVWIMGIFAESPYLRGLLDMIEVKPDFLTCGDYKSAAEIFMRRGPSPEAERMLAWLLDSIYETCVTLVAEGRGVSTEKAREWIDGGPYTAKRAKKLGIIDSVQFRQDFLADLKAKYGDGVQFDKKYAKKKRRELDLSSPLAVLKLWAELFQGPKKKAAEKNAVAVVYVEGPILTGKADVNPFVMEKAAYSTPIRKALDKVAGDDSVKAVVLRIDSPGGSAVASEIILDATKRVKAKKPFVVSMGGVAASGGYYVACAADTIFADASTITASIGVVGGKLATTGMWNKIGITWHSSKRGANADMLSSEDVFTDEQRKRLQAVLDEIYSTFKGHVVAARGDRLKKDIDQIAGGRVYTGRQALELGLVDRIGSLEDAIAYCAKQAKIKDYEVRVVPRPKTFMELLSEDLIDQDEDDDAISTWLGRLIGDRSVSLFDAALPYQDRLDPDRLDVVKTALKRLALLQDERAVLMMPEIYIGQ